MNKKEIERKVEKLLRQLTVKEKVRLCHAVSKFTSGGVERLNIPALTMSDGPHGVREEIAADSWDAVGGDNDFATYLPTGTALAATWNAGCARKFGEVLGAEARERGKDVILGPGVNMIRSPLCGRNFEYYSEDPFLAGELGAAAVKGIQSQGTAACVKHYALNSQELMRHEVDARCDERTLREIYLPAFEKAVIDGGAMTIMGAYNNFRGQHCCQNDYLLNEILKREWGFDGVVISDWAGVHDTFEAAKFGMDIEMGTGSNYDAYYLADAFEKAVEEGKIEPSILDDKARRILRLMYKLGILGGGERPAGSRNTRKHQEIAKKIALEAITLLKNRSRVLPLNPDKIKKLLVVGDNATRRHHLGGHSSAVKALYEITPLEGIRNFLRDYPVEVEFIPGYPSDSGASAIPSGLMGIADAGAGTRGWRCEIFDNHACSGEPVAVMPLEQAGFDPDQDLPESLKGKDFGVIIKGDLTPEKDEVWEFFLDGVSQAALVCEGANWIENCKSEENLRGSAKVEMKAGHVYSFTLPIHLHVNMPFFPVRLTAKIGENAAPGGMNDELEQAAKTADAVLFFGGLNHTFDTEGSDRKDMALHGGQNELIEKLAALNDNLAVVIVSGSPVEMPWVDKVPAIVQMWYSGMECGNAVAEILFGKVCPSGKLPFTFPEKLQDSPAHALNDYDPAVCNYSEGVLMGYRWFDAVKCEPLFSFGHGLSYTVFEYSDMKIEELEDGYQVSVKIKNTGKMTGAETAQLYVVPPKCRFVRPPRELKGFAKCELAPGKSRRVSFKLDFRSFAFYNPEIGDWEITPGRYRIEVGAGSRDIRVTESIKLG